MMKTIGPAFGTITPGPLASTCLWALWGPLRSRLDTYMDAQEVMHMTDYSKITALYSRLSVGDEDRDGGESNSIQNQKYFWRTMPEGST